jgi:hypothetical protein
MRVRFIEGKNAVTGSTCTPERSRLMRKVVNIEHLRFGDVREKDIHEELLAVERRASGQ